MTNEELNDRKAAMFEALTDLFRALSAIATTAHNQVVAAAAAEAKKVSR